MWSLWSRRAACLMLLVVLAQGLLTGCSASTPASGSSVVPSFPPTQDLPVPTSLALSATEALVLRGQALFRGEEPFAGTVSCASCHTTEPGARATIGPNLAGVAVRSATRMSQLDAATYLERSIRVHDEFIVPGFSEGLVPALVGTEFGTLLTDEQIRALVAYLLTLTDGDDLAVPTGGNAPARLVEVSPTRIIEPSVMDGSTVRTPLATTAIVATDASIIPSGTVGATLTITRLVVPAPTTNQGLPTTTSAPAPTPEPATATRAPVPATEPATATRAPVPATEPATATFVSAPTPEPATATFVSAPTPEPATATRAPAPTMTALPTPPEPPTPSLPGLPNESDLSRYTNCVTCHNLHPLQVQMPHPLNPSCNTCHRGSPNQIGCLSCHSIHGIDNKHEPSPALTCASCHN